jgi:hypothetical protein
MTLVQPRLAEPHYMAPLLPVLSVRRSGIAVPRNSALVARDMFWDDVGSNPPRHQITTLVAILVAM